MRVLITSGAGFIGSHLVDKLVRDGYRVGVTDNLSSGRVGVAIT
jgi:UDP-glucose 4-epimerase